ncbi:protein kinase [Streptomyces sp. NPDC020965]|uniref:serine/threonine-protein kinase n=1 Tax=Streptomyces sp. NPDC020965 TaxID=3365105 RepID=UPI0037B90C29
MGEVFAGRYELIDPIGRGGVGAVWRAWDHRRRRYVAAKVLQQSDAHTLLRFVREQALRIDHPHVLAPASWAADDDKVLFTMDLVSGGSLAHVIGDYGPLPPRYVCTLLDQLLSGLAGVHAEGVVHRDIKPANVLLEATGTGRPHLRLSDFGISMRKGEPRLTETNYVVGTPGYFAPEQMSGAEPDFTADLFAVGLVALYLLQGQKPDSGALVEHFIHYGTPGAPQGMPEPLWQVLAGLLQPDPEARFRTATGARKALASAVEMLPEAGPDDEPVEIFDQLGPLPTGFGPDGPERTPTPGPRPSSPPTPPVALPDHGSDNPTGTPPPPPPAPAGPPGTASAGTAPGLPPAGPPGTTSGAPPDAGPDAAPTQAPGTAPVWPPGHTARHASVQPPDSALKDRAPQASEAASGAASGAPISAPPDSARSGAQPLTRPPSEPPWTGGFPVPPPPPQPPTPPPHPARPTAPLTGQAPVQPTPTPAQAPAGTPASVPAHHGSPSYAYAPEPLPWAPQPPHPTPTAPTTPGRPEPALTRKYTAQSPQVPLARTPARRAARRRAGPPPKVAVPVLVLALICFAVGFWALSQP